MSSDDCCIARFLTCFLYYIGPLVLLFYLFKYTGLNRKLQLRLSSAFMQTVAGKSAILPEVIAAKTALFETLHTGTECPVILEVGAGDCRNLQYYPKDSELIVVEPNPNYYAAIRRRAAEVGAHVHLKRIVTGYAEKLDHVKDESVDAYVMTHVTCSVSDMNAVLTEAKRVLRKGGRLYIFHHFNGPNKNNKSLRAVLERWTVIPVLAALMECDMDKHIEDDIKKHFKKTEVKIVQLPHPLITIRYHLITRSTKD